MLDKSNAWKTLELFFKRPRYSFHLRELCRELGWSPIKVRSVVLELKRQNLVSESREKNLVLFKSNRDGEQFKRYNMVYNLLKAYEILLYPPFRTHKVLYSRIRIRGLHGVPPRP
jgi:hypothetical protein